MTLAGDFASLMALWGQSLTIARSSFSYADSGSATPTWTQVDAVTGMIQPMVSPDGTTKRPQAGEQAESFADIYVPATTTVRQGDRVRPAGWVAGQDEWQVYDVQTFSPSHTQLLATRTRGHAS